MSRRRWNRQAPRSPEEQRERRAHLVDVYTKQAEKHERGGVGYQPDIIATAFQEQGRYTADPVYDNSIQQVVDHRHQRLAIKERGVGPDGDYEITVSPVMIDALRDGLFCHNCENPMPEDRLVWKRAALRTKQLIEGIGTHIPSDFHESGFGTHCCYCAARLGFITEGEHKAPQANILTLTPDQRRLLEGMFAPIQSPG